MNNKIENIVKDLSMREKMELITALSNHNDIFIKNIKSGKEYWSNDWKIGWSGTHIMIMDDTDIDLPTEGELV